MFEGTQRPKKRLFLALILLSIIFLTGTVFFIWKLMLPGLQSISSYLPIIVGGFIMFVIILSAVLFLSMVLAVMGMPVFKFLQPLAWNLVIVLFPFAIFLGRLVSIDKEGIERSFIELSNHLFKEKRLSVPPDRVLLLLPHCLQLDTCPHKITQNVNNCKQCGGCSIGGLLAICNKYHVHMAVVPGGTLARRVVKQLRPKVVLAVACERDLTSGIQDVFPLPVFGILNERPEGPCYNTCVNVNNVEKVISKLLTKGEICEENK